MFTLPDHFKLLLSNIEPDEQRAKKAQEIPNQIRDFLQSSEDIKTVTPHTRLAGSYARCTAIKYIKDVDIILLIASEYIEQDPEEVLDLLFQVLQGLPEALDETGEVVICRHQRRSVNVHLEKSDFDLDIVPAVVVTDLDNPLQVPDKDWSKWVATHPLGYGDALSKLNAARKDKVVPVIKLLKHWRDVHMIYRRPKSYWLECMVYHRFDDKTLSADGKSYAEIFRDLLASIYNDYLPDYEKDNAVPKVKDPMLGNNVAHNWERDNFEAFMRRIYESYRWAERALASDDAADAISLWQKVFGDEWFPQNADQFKAESLKSAAVAGSIFVTPSGRVETIRPEGRAVQAQPQRFYGER